MEWIQLTAKIPGLRWLGKFLGWVLAFKKEQTPFTVVMTFDGVRGMPYSVVTNHTKDVPLYVDAVRAHCGMKSHTIAIQFLPLELLYRDPPPPGQRLPQVFIAPKSKVEFYIDIWDAPSYVFSEWMYRESKDMDEDRSPAKNSYDLCRAIMFSPPEDSWIEVDFNEQHRLVFLKGKIKWPFERLYEVASPERKTWICP